MGNVGFRNRKRSLVRSRATPAAPLAVTVHVREHVPALADSPSLDELGIEPSAESRAVALELIVSGHPNNGTAGSKRFAGAKPTVCWLPTENPLFPAWVVTFGQRDERQRSWLMQQLVLWRSRDRRIGA